MTQDNSQNMNYPKISTEDEIEKLMLDCLCVLYCPKTKFYPNKDYGSMIRFCRANTEEYLLAYARQGLSYFDGVYVKSVVKEQSQIKFNLLINDEERTVTLPYGNDV